MSCGTVLEAPMKLNVARKMFQPARGYLRSKGARPDMNTRPPKQRMRYTAHSTSGTFQLSLKSWSVGVVRPATSRNGPYGHQSFSQEAKNGSRKGKCWKDCVASTELRYELLRSVWGKVVVCVVWMRTMCTWRDRLVEEEEMRAALTRQSNTAGLVCTGGRVVARKG